MYGINPLTLLDLLPLPLSERVNLYGKTKAEFMKTIHEDARRNIERRTETYVKQANNGRREVVFKPRDCVWLHIRKEQFPDQRKSKLQQQRDGPFQVTRRINNNTYQLDLPGEYNVSATFNVANISPFLAYSDLRANSFKEEENDVIMHG